MEPVVDVVCEMSNSKMHFRRTHLQFLYGVLKATIGDQSKSYQEKVSSLLSTWECAASLTQNSTESIDSLMDDLYKHTLRLVLQGEWPNLPVATKTHLKVTVKRCINVVHSSNHHRYIQLQQIIENPWTHPVMSCILKSREEEISEVEVSNFCESEGSCLMLTRLELLVGEKNCRDLALRLSRSCFKNWLSKLVSYDALQEKLLDIHVALLFKQKAYAEITDQVFRHMPLEVGLQLIRHHLAYATESETSRLWKQSNKIALFASWHFLITQSEVHPNFGDLAVLWFDLQKSSGMSSFQDISDILMKKKLSSILMYKIASSLYKKIGVEVKPLCIQLFVLGLNQEINEMEKHKLENNVDQVREHELSMSCGFLRLADLLYENIKVSRECILTAFSLNPTSDIFSKIQSIASIEACNNQGMCQNCNASAINGVVNKSSVSCPITPICIMSPNCLCTGHTATVTTSSLCCGIPSSSDLVSDCTTPVASCPPISCTPSIVRNVTSPCDNTTLISNTKDAENSIEAVCVKCGNVYLSENINPTTDVPNLYKDDTLNITELKLPGLPPGLCDDLLVVVTSARWHVLSWDLSSSDLKALCERYMQDPKGTRNVITELKYLNVDYSQFQSMPSPEIDEFVGIEEGYEHLLFPNNKVPKKLQKKINSRAPKSCAPVIANKETLPKKSARDEVSSDMSKTVKSSYIKSKLVGNNTFSKKRKCKDELEPQKSNESPKNLKFSLYSMTDSDSVTLQQAKHNITVSSLQSNKLVQSKARTISVLSEVPKTPEHVANPMIISSNPTSSASLNCAVSTTEGSIPTSVSWIVKNNWNKLMPQSILKKNVKNIGILKKQSVQQRIPKSLKPGFNYLCNPGVVSNEPSQRSSTLLHSKNVPLPSLLPNMSRQQVSALQLPQTYKIIHVPTQATQLPQNSKSKQHTSTVRGIQSYQRTSTAKMTNLSYNQPPTPVMIATQFYQKLPQFINNMPPHTSNIVTNGLAPVIQEITPATQNVHSNDKMTQTTMHTCQQATQASKIFSRVPMHQSFHPISSHNFSVSSPTTINVSHSNNPASSSKSVSNTYSPMDINGKTDVQYEVASPRNLTLQSSVTGTTLSPNSQCISGQTNFPNFGQSLLSSNNRKTLKSMCTQLKNSDFAVTPKTIADVDNDVNHSTLAAASSKIVQVKIPKLVGLFSKDSSKFNNSDISEESIAMELQHFEEIIREVKRQTSMGSQLFTNNSSVEQVHSTNMTTIEQTTLLPIINESGEIVGCIAPPNVNTGNQLSNT